MRGARALAALALAFAALPGTASGEGLVDRAEALAREAEPRVIEWRRHIHRNPELSYEERETAAFIAARLRAMPGIEVRTGIAKTGVKAVLRGARPGPVVALRADMDALPVEEKSGLPFASRAKAPWKGKDTFVAHACGHDTHVAMLLGAAEVLSRLRAELAGTVVFLFQPAEEWGEPGGTIPSGAVAMVREGALADPKVDFVLGQHIGAEAPSRTLRYRRGALMASADDFEIVVKGKGTHGAFPWKGRDPIVVAAQITLALQGIVGREMDLVEEGPVVVSIGSFQAGNRENIIPEEARLAGTIRSLSGKSRVAARESLQRKAEKIAEASGLTAEVRFLLGPPPLLNHPALADRVVPALERAAGPGRAFEVPPIMAAEDFGAYAEGGIPTMYWFLAASPHGERPGAPNHSPEFAVDEAALAVGVRALVGATLEILRRPAGV